MDLVYDLSNYWSGCLTSSSFNSKRRQNSSYSSYTMPHAQHAKPHLWSFTFPFRQKQANFPCGRKFCGKARKHERMQGACLMKILWECRQWQIVAVKNWPKNKVPQKRNDGKQSKTTRETRIWVRNKRKAECRVNGEKNPAVYSIWIQSGSTTELWEI